jgi:hypothetical protein
MEAIFRVNWRGLLLRTRWLLPRNFSTAPVRGIGVILFLKKIENNIEK